jgi:hypothetical protein
MSKRNVNSASEMTPERNLNSASEMTPDGNLNSASEMTPERNLNSAQHVLQKALHRRLYAARKEAGLCPVCGVRPPYEGYVRCVQCMRRQRTVKRRWNNRQKEMRRQKLLG